MALLYRRVLRGDLDVAQPALHIMTSLRLIRAVALSLLLATPAMAMRRVDHHRGATARHARGFGYRSVYGAYGFDRGGILEDFDRRNTFN